MNHVLSASLVPAHVTKTGFKQVSRTLHPSATGQTNRPTSNSHCQLSQDVAWECFQTFTKLYEHFLTTLSGRQDVWGSSERHLRSLGSDFDSLKHCISQTTSPAGVTQEILLLYYPISTCYTLTPICAWSRQPLLHVTSLSAFVLPYNTFQHPVPTMCDVL